MKEIKGNYTGDIIWGMIMLVIFGISILGSKDHLTVFLCAIPIMFMVFFFMSLSQFYFLYDKKKIMVKNPIWPFFLYEYDVSEIDKIAVKTGAYLGRYIKIYFKNGKRKSFHTNVPSDKISEMIQELLGEENPHTKRRILKS